MTDQEWRSVVDYPLYEVSSGGDVRSWLSGYPRILSPVSDNYGYLTVKLHSRRFKVHRLVCEAFNGSPPPGSDAAHIDGSRTNNRADNLMWASRKQNIAHKKLHGTHQAGERHGGAKITSAQAEEIRQLASNGESRRAIGRELGISHTQIDRIVNGEHWVVASRLGPTGECQAQLLKLAERCENASGPDQLIDFWISVRISGTRHTDAELQADIDLVGIEGMVIDAPFTASIDAATALVPEGWEVSIYWGVEAFLPEAQLETWQMRRDMGASFEPLRGEAATPALALCAAALRARAASVDTHPKDGDGEATAPLVSGAVPPVEAGDAQNPPKG